MVPELLRATSAEEARRLLCQELARVRGIRWDLLGCGPVMSGGADAAVIPVELGGMAGPWCAKVWVHVIIDPAGARLEIADVRCWAAHMSCPGDVQSLLAGRLHQIGAIAEPTPEAAAAWCAQVLRQELPAVGPFRAVVTRGAAHAYATAAARSLGYHDYSFAEIDAARALLRGISGAVEKEEPDGKAVSS